MNVFRVLLAGIVGMVAFALSTSEAEGVWFSCRELAGLGSSWSSSGLGSQTHERPMVIAGTPFAGSVGPDAAGTFRVELAGHARRFCAQVGVDDSSDGLGSVEFTISADGRVLWRSGAMTRGLPARPVDVDLTGARILSLNVIRGGGGSSGDHADWADARIEMVAGSDQPEVIFTNKQFSVSSKTFSLDFEAGEDGRLYQRKLCGSEGDARMPRSSEAYPQAGDGYIWDPALQVVHADGNTSTHLEFDNVVRSRDATGRELVRVRLHDPAYPLQVVLCFLIDSNRDVIEQWTEISHQERGAVTLEHMASSALLFGGRVWLTHFFGDWGEEMLAPTTELLTPGTKSLDSKLGVRADQFNNPSFILSFDGPPRENRGRVLAGSFEWSGSFECAFDDNGQGIRALCGINPFMSAYHLQPGETFTTPKMLWAWSDQGLGDMSRKLHDWARDFGMRDGHKTRAVLLNNWEATGFDFDFNRIASLFAPAKELGVELFLLDDGWFGNKYPRIDDHAGLGDWQPNRKRLPGGLAPLAEAAVNDGLRFGIWMEPEMVNPDSVLFHEHPDWVIREPKRPLELQRHQLVLDLTRPAVQRFEWNAISNILSVPNITYAKWDCNRYLTQPGSSYLPPDRQSDLWIDYVHALYALMDKTVKTFPNTEMMLCSGGGGRVDFGALKYFQEFWPSDNTDPVARVAMQWDYSYFFPPMGIASHVTHWGNRPMHFACSVAMSARFGMDLDLTKLSAQDKEVCAGAIAAYKQIRAVTTFGDLYRLENPHQTYRGVIEFVSPDRARAVVFVFQLQNGPPSPAYPQGFVPARSYTVHELNRDPHRAAIPQEGETRSGAEWMREGIVPSCAHAVEASVIEFESK